MFKKVFFVLVLIALAIPAGQTFAQENGCTASFNPTTEQWTFVNCTPSEARAYMEEFSGEGVSGNGTDTDPVSNNGWDIVWYSGATDQMRGEGQNAWPTFEDLNPSEWPEFPNVDNPSQGFDSSHGLEFGEDESEFCGVRGDACEVTVPAMHYRIITGDWSIPGIGECSTNEDQPNGCALMLVNVGLVTSNWAENVELNNVYTVSGRYWNGDFLPEAVVAGLSHMVWNMTNGTSQLNPEDSVNAGANCSNPKGCPGVIATFAITSGNEVLAKGETTYVAKPSAHSPTRLSSDK